MTLLTKLLLTTLLPSLVLLSALSVYFYLQTRTSVESEMSLRLIGLARILAMQVEPQQVLLFSPGDEQSRSYRALADKLRLLAEANDAARVYIVKPDETILFDTSESGFIGEKLYQLAGHRRELKLVQQHQPVASTLFRGADGIFYKSGFAPILVENETIAILGVDAGARFFTLMKQMRRSLTALALVGLGLIALVITLFARRLTYPLRELAKSAQRIGEGDYRTPIAVPTGDEIQLLGETLNDMRLSIVERDRTLQMMQRGIAHEVRNPLGGMELYCDILTDELAGRPELLPHVDKIRQELKGLGAVVNEFLDFTREQTPELRPVPLRDYFAELLMVYAPMAEKQHVAIHTAIDDGATTAVFDPDLLRRALHNLLLNALQAMPQGGQLTVAAHHQANALELTLSDTGKGMPPAVLEQVFSPFYTTKEKGTGLGLPFAQKVVNSHGGRIVMESSVGEGSTVRVILPQPAAKENE